MSYQTECVVCGKTGTVPGRHERVTGEQLYRTLSDEYEAVAHTAAFSDDPEERRKARYRAEKMGKYDHYCEKHAAGIGIVPAPDVKYRCESCGELNEYHKTVPSGQGQSAACVDCGETAIVREPVKVDR